MTTLRERREALGLSQAQLSRALGVPPHTWSRWERGALRVQHPQLLSLALDALDTDAATTGTSARNTYRGSRQPIPAWASAVPLHVHRPAL